MISKPCKTVGGSLILPMFGEPQILTAPQISGDAFPATSVILVPVDHLMFAYPWGLCLCPPSRHSVCLQGKIPEKLKPGGLPAVSSWLYHMDTVPKRSFENSVLKLEWFVNFVSSVSPSHTVAACCCVALVLGVWRWGEGAVAWNGRISANPVTTWQIKKQRNCSFYQIKHQDLEILLNLMMKWMHCFLSTLNIS